MCALDLQLIGEMSINEDLAFSLSLPAPAEGTSLFLVILTQWIDRLFHKTSKKKKISKKGVFIREFGREVVDF